MEYSPKKMQDLLDKNEFRLKKQFGQNTDFKFYVSGLTLLSPFETCFLFRLRYIFET